MSVVVVVVDKWFFCSLIIYCPTEVGRFASASVGGGVPAD